MLEITCLYKTNLKRKRMWKLKEKYKTKDYVFFDPNELSEENKTIILEKYPDLFDEHFTII